jgi:hypothetical protein
MEILKLVPDAIFFSSFFKSGYLMMLSVLGLYSVDDGMVNECGAVECLLYLERS